MHVCNMQRREEECTLSIIIKYTEGKFGNLYTTLVTQQQTDGITLEITNKMPLKKVIIAKKKENYHQTEEPCPLINDPWLYLDIEASSECPQVKAILEGTYVCLDNTYPYVKKYFRHLQLPTTVSD